jgi:stage II sporulation protein D
LAGFAILIKLLAVFKGIGWGHGVGMCQWGAYQMSRERYTYDEILQFYYPGTIIKDYQDME